MTLAPPRNQELPPSQADGPVAAITDVSAVLVLHDAQEFLVESLDALAQQTRPPQRLVVVDTGSSDNSLQIVACHDALRRAVPEQRVVRMSRETTYGQAVDEAVRVLPQHAAQASNRSAWLWLLHDDTAPAPMALARLLEAARDSEAIGVLGPKLATWDDARLLLSVGMRYTRTGRAVGGPVAAEPDQGQHDDRSDVLGLSSAAMLVRRDVYERIGAFENIFADGCADLDFSWRAHLAGYRVVVVPGAVAREGAATRRGLRPDAPDPRATGRVQRRRARQVALTRCSLAMYPLMALWTAVVALGSALGLLLLKRPRDAAAELTDVSAVLGSARTLGARLRFRGRRQVSRRRLDGLFATARESWRAKVDAIRDTQALARGGPKPVSGTSRLETGPVCEDAEAMPGLALTWPQRVVRHPGFLAVLLAFVVCALTWRSMLTGPALSGGGTGLAGGQLLPLDTGWRELWHAWLDGWHGPGLGTAAQAPAYLPVLAAASWLVGLLPWVPMSASPAGTAVAWFLLGAPALSVWSAYLGGRAATRARWPRAWAALTWGFVGSLGPAVAQGRLGAVVVHVLLPLLAGGFALVVRRHCGISLVVATAVALAVSGTFAPPVLAVGVLCCALGALLAPGWARLRCLVLGAAALVMYGPGLVDLLSQPRTLLSGPGLTLTGGAHSAPWQVVLWHPVGPWTLAGFLAVPAVAIGVLALFTSGPARRGLSGVAVVAVSGLVLALAAPHVVLLQLPAAAGGVPVTPWPGIGLDIAQCALLGAALLAFGGLGSRAVWRRMRRHASGAARAAWSALRVGVVTAVVALAVAATLLSAGDATIAGPGSTLSPATATLPAVAEEQATGPPANRMLLLAPRHGTLTYQLVGAEPGAAARDLPRASPPANRRLAAAVHATISDLAPAQADAARARLADLGVGFVGYHGSPTDALVAHIDAAGGLSRLGTTDGVVLWRVLPASGGTGGVAPSRLRVVVPSGAEQVVASSGPNGAADTPVPAGSTGRLLVVAEPAGWAEHALVRYDGRTVAVRSSADRPTYALPAGAGRLSITVEPSHIRWRWAQFGVLALCVLLAVPLGGRSRRRAAR